MRSWECFAHISFKLLVNMIFGRTSNHGGQIMLCKLHLSTIFLCSFDVVRTLTDSGKDILYLEQEMG